MASMIPRRLDGPSPIWPRALPDANRLHPAYGRFADEFVVLFGEDRHLEGYFDVIATPSLEYAAIKIDTMAGEVIGVLVYPLAAWAVKVHPAWRQAMAPYPSPAVARRIVLDIKDLYDRYGRTPETAS